MIAQCNSIATRPTPQNDAIATSLLYNYDAQNKPKYEKNDEQIISVRITSSVAINRGRTATVQKSNDFRKTSTVTTLVPILEKFERTVEIGESKTNTLTTEIPPSLIGANIEFIKQLNARKELKNQSRYGHKQVSQSNDEHQQGHKTEHLYEGIKTVYDNENKESNFEYSPEIESIEEIKENIENVPLGRSVGSALHSVDHSKDKELHSTPITTYGKSNEDTVDTIAEPSLKSLLTIHDISDENDENIPLARSVHLSPSSKNLIQTPTKKPPNERESSQTLTTVSFNIVHDVQPSNYNNNLSDIYTAPNSVKDNAHSFYEPPKIYSEPAKVYGEPSKIYSVPAKIYSEPAKIYSEPAKIYSEPAKVYGEPAKFYSEPASLHLEPENRQNTYTPWQNPIQSTSLTIAPWGPSKSSPISYTMNTTPTILETLPNNILNEHQNNLPLEKDQKLVAEDNIMSKDRKSETSETSTEKCKEDNCKVGYVVEGKQYKKYRVEERTPDGFIVGEYGVVRNEDGALRGVRYTADSEASPGLINDALMKFLQL